ncbi:PREDICTED: U7 snRNA-associated Sm-like protein LSm10 [Dufourea novaeangliae]|uniref:U7 snRNA-associated Sm-like protein LSm10 n=1 Tax=Dufourea novaeangliae TaxID=178035 RepID=UPI00076762E0|nr:PREDICTED: U7 snRNA-associated Sm-like protein LSm10 [Dufourea novaeangliae]
MNFESRKERFKLFNSLAILLKAVENEKTTVDLRNEGSVYGTVEYADAVMNIVMKDCIFTDPRGDSHNYDMFFVQARNIRYVHIPPKIRIIPAIKERIQHLISHKKGRTYTKSTFRRIRAEQKQREGLVAVEKILDERKNPEDPANSELNKT